MLTKNTFSLMLIFIDGMIFCISECHNVHISHLTITLIWYWLKIILPLACATLGKCIREHAAWKFSNLESCLKFHTCTLFSENQYKLEPIQSLHFSKKLQSSKPHPLSNMLLKSKGDFFWNQFYSSTDFIVSFHPCCQMIDTARHIHTCHRHL